MVSKIMAVKLILKNQTFRISFLSSALAKDDLAALNVRVAKYASDKPQDWHRSYSEQQYILDIKAATNNPS